MKNCFRGYYYKHQNGTHTVSFIPGTSSDGAFIQVITDTFSRIYRMDNAVFGEGYVTLGGNLFCKNGIAVTLPDIAGTVLYTGTTPLRSDIMGVFRFFPMECRHEVVSMRHKLAGSLVIDGEMVDFSGGTGYIEGDSGRSFPDSYLWIQANDFPCGESFMLSLARIPFGLMRFRGVICVLVAGGHEYRFATYLGVRVKTEGNRVVLKQGDMALEITVLSRGEGYSLASPDRGRMSGIIRECNNAAVRIVLLKGSRVLWHGESSCAGYEKHPDVGCSK